MVIVVVKIRSVSFKYRAKHDAEPLVNVQDSARGMTPLHFACSDNNRELVELLLKKRADPNIR